MDLRAVIFMPALAGAAICVFAFLMFAAHYYLTVLESTATGARPVTWVEESIPEKFWKPFYLGGLLVLWLGPAHVIGRALAANAGAPHLTFVVPLGVAWLLYPVSQLSSLAARSVWVPLHPQVFARVAQRPGAALGFLLLSLPVFALGGVAFRWAFLTKDEWPRLFAGVPLLALALFAYARLLGRLAFVLTFTRDLFQKRRKKQPAAPSAAPRPGDDAPAFEQPSELPPLNTPDGELAGYNVLAADDDGPPVPKKRVVAEAVDDAPDPAAWEGDPPPRPAAREPGRAWSADDEDASPYGVSEPADPPPPPPPPEPTPEPRRKRPRRPKGENPEELSAAVKEELALRDRSDVATEPARVWSGELFAFFGQPATVGALVALTFIGLVAGTMVRVARTFDPTAGPG